MLSRKNHRLLIYYPNSKAYEEILKRELTGVEVHSAENPEDAFSFVEEAEILFSSTIIPDELLRRAKRLVWFASMSAGNERLIGNPLLASNVLFTKMTVYGEMMAEYVFAYLLYFVRNGSKHLEDQRKKIWDTTSPGRLRGKMLGILGLGSVGKEIARQGKQFGMHVIGIKRSPQAVDGVDQVFGLRDLERVISTVDYLVNVLPLTPETHHLLGEREFALLKEGTLFFNIGRGKTIDEGALIRTLKAGKIRAVLDVFETEPLPPESELWNLENVTLTPHVSGINIPQEVCAGFIENYKRWIKGEPLIGLIDRKKGY